MLNIRKLIISVAAALCFGLPSNARELDYYQDPSTGKYGYKDEFGNVVIQPQFDGSWGFCDGLAQALLNGKYGYIDETGKFVIQPQFVCAWNFSKNGLAAVQLNDKWGFINKSGKYVIQPKFDDAYWFTDDGLAQVKLNGKWGFIDKTGKFVVQPNFDFVYMFSDNGLAAVELNGKTGYIDKSGKFVIQPQFDETYGFYNGLAAVKINGKWRYINETGKFVIGLQFDEAGYFAKNGLARVKLNGKYGYIDKRGVFVIRPQYDATSGFCDNGLAPTKLSSKWGYIDETGEFVIQPQFDSVNGFSNKGIAQVKLNNTDGYITESGEFYSTKAQALAAVKEQKYNIKAGESYADYISRFVPTWDKYLQEKGIVKPEALSAETVKQTVEKEVNVWQQKGEFETTAMWQARVNNETRAAKVSEITKRIEKEYNAKVADYNTRASQVRNAYEGDYKLYSDKYCAAKAKEFAKQNLELKPYDADNGTFLILTADYGDILLPVPLAQAQQFKSNWSSIKSSVMAEFVPTGNDVALKSVTFGDYTYDGNTKANYAVTTVDYNFAPIEISNMDLASVDYNFDQISSAPTVTVSNPDAKTITTTKVTPETKRVVAGNASDVDINIPKGASTAKNTFAIVIANESYKNAETVENAANDGKVVAKYLTSTLGIPGEQVYAYTDATYGDMLSALDKIKNIAKAYRGSDFNVLFYYAGHGVPDEQSYEAYLLPADGIPGNTAVNISLSDLYSTLGSLGASSVCVMLDACFSGTQRGEGMLAQARGVKIKAKSAAPQGNMVVLSAAQGDETAYPYKDKSHGMFTYFLLKKLQESAGNVTIGELADYVIDNVRKTSVIKNNGKIQTPSVSASASAANTWRAQRLIR